jgi:NMD protein affecting ribosome stability and mRNA decay
MADRECPVCANTHHLCTVDEAKNVYDTRSWRGNTGLMQVSSATLVCAWCKSIQIDGEWTRMQSVDSRAAELAQQNSKSKSEYRDSLTAGSTRA